MTTSTPRWLQQHATTTGTDPTLTGTHARPRHCRTCRRLVLAGYDAPLLAALAITDPYALTPQLETAAVLLDIPTWQLHGTPTRYELEPRHRPHVPVIGSKPPADVVTVLAEHRCEHPPLSTTPIPLAPENTTRPLGEPPF